MPDAELPDAALTMLNTRLVNSWLHTHYSLEEVAAMPDLVFDVLAALRQGMDPPQAGAE